MSITLPPLSNRRDEISLLLQHSIQEFSEENAVPPVNIDTSAIKILEKYDWPGNIRELRNFAENVVVMKRGSNVTKYDLEQKVSNDMGDLDYNDEMINPLSVEENEKRLLRNALVEVGGNRTKAAKLLGISRRTLHRKLQQWPELDVVA